MSHEPSTINSRFRSNILKVLSGSLPGCHLFRTSRSGSLELSHFNFVKQNNVSDMCGKIYERDAAGEAWSKPMVLVAQNEGLNVSGKRREKVIN